MENNTNKVNISIEIHTSTIQDAIDVLKAYYNRIKKSGCFLHKGKSTISIKGKKVGVMAYNCNEEASDEHFLKLIKKEYD